MLCVYDRERGGKRRIEIRIKTLTCIKMKVFPLVTGIDILVNNASAISLTNTLETPTKRVDLMMSVNTRGTYLT